MNNLTQAGHLIRQQGDPINPARARSERREKLEDLAETRLRSKALQDVVSSLPACLRMRMRSQESFTALKGIQDSMQKSIFRFRHKTDKDFLCLCRDSWTLIASPLTLLHRH